MTKKCPRKTAPAKKVKNLQKNYFIKLSERHTFEFVGNIDTMLWKT